MTRLVRLEPPYSRSGASASHYADMLPVLRGPRLVRGSRSGRWHRPRSAIHFISQGRTSFQLWCGQHASSTDVITGTEVPDGDPLCGTCEGRAIGAGHPPIGVELLAALVFEPASRFRRPAVCPAASMFISDQLARSVPWRASFPCPACEDHTKLRGAGGWSNPHVKIAGHPPVGQLVDPCPFHGWDRLTMRPDHVRAVCACTPREAAPRRALTSATNGG